MNQEEPESRLPLEDAGLVGSEGESAGPTLSKWKLLLAAVLFFFTGGIVGMYFQPPGLQAFFNITGLAPGGGTDTPIAQAIEQVRAQDDIAVLSEGDVVALGRLVPEGDVMTVAPPFGAGDARIQKIDVKVGQQVAKGERLVVLDSLQQIEIELEKSRASVSLSRARLQQTKQSVAASLKESRASLARALDTADERQAQVRRAATLFKKGVTTRAEYDASQARANESIRDVERARATLTRFATPDGIVQPDIAISEANLQLAEADLRRRQLDRDKAIVRAPADGTVLDIHTAPGEKPGSGGILDLGNLDSMTAEVEVYQSMIGRVIIGDPVVLIAEPIKQNLVGTVTAIGWEIGRQSITSDDPAANTDARVVDVIVTLDAQSSALASRFTNLEVVARIDTDNER